MFAEQDLVRLKGPIPFLFLDSGAIGRVRTVIPRRDGPDIYLIEFIDGDGNLLRVTEVQEGLLEKASHFSA